MKQASVASKRISCLRLAPLYRPVTPPGIAHGQFLQVRFTCCVLANHNALPLVTPQPMYKYIVAKGSDMECSCDVGVSLHSKPHPLFMKCSRGTSAQCHANLYPSLFPAVLLFYNLYISPFNSLGMGTQVRKSARFDYNAPHP